MPALSTTAIAAFLAYKRWKKRLLAKARKRANLEVSIHDKWYISIPATRTWQDLQAGMSDQKTLMDIEKCLAYVKSFGGENPQVADSAKETRIYFQMTRVAVPPMVKEIRSFIPKVSYGEVKVIK